jgi:hypothetical protein
MTDEQNVVSHYDCAQLWRLAKESARLKGITLPDKITAMPSRPGWYFVEGLNDKGEYIEACCAIKAKAQRIQRIIASR